MLRNILYKLILLTYLKLKLTNMKTKNYKITLASAAALFFVGGVKPMHRI